MKLSIGSLGDMKEPTIGLSGHNGRKISYSKCKKSTGKNNFYLADS